MKKYIHIFELVLVTIIVLFGGLYLIGKYILPDVLGSLEVVKEVPKAIPGESLLNKRAPLFNLPDIDGGRTKLSDFFGQPVVLVFWTTWNRESADQIQILERYLADHNAQARLVKILSISSQEDPSVTASYMRRGGYSVPTLLDAFGDVSKTYNIKSLPTIYFISRDGSVSEIYSGALSVQGFVEKVDSLLAKMGV